MTIAVSEAAKILEARGALRWARKDHSDWVIDFVAGQIGQPLPADLAEFYRANIEKIGDFNTTIPIWDPHMGSVADDADIGRLLPAKAVPIFGDGCGSLYGVDLSSGEESPAVYFFDHENAFEFPSYAAGSSIGTFVLLLAEKDDAHRDGRPPNWALAIDPDIDKCPRAPPVWLAG